MPVIFGPTLRRLADGEGTEGDRRARSAPSRSADERPPRATDGPTPAVTGRRVALVALVAGAVAWLAARRRRGRSTPPLEPPFSR